MTRYWFHNARLCIATLLASVWVVANGVAEAAPVVDSSEGHGGGATAWTWFGKSTMVTGGKDGQIIYWDIDSLLPSYRIYRYVPIASLASDRLLPPVIWYSDGESSGYLDGLTGEINEYGTLPKAFFAEFLGNGNMVAIEPDSTQYIFKHSQVIRNPSRREGAKGWATELAVRDRSTWDEDGSIFELDGTRVIQHMDGKPEYRNIDIGVSGASHIRYNNATRRVYAVGVDGLGFWMASVDFRAGRDPVHLTRFGEKQCRIERFAMSLRGDEAAVQCVSGRLLVIDLRASPTITFRVDLRFSVVGLTYALDDRLVMLKKSGAIAALREGRVYENGISEVAKSTKACDRNARRIATALANQDSPPPAFFLNEICNQNRPGENEALSAKWVTYGRGGGDTYLLLSNGGRQIRAYGHVRQISTNFIGAVSAARNLVISYGDDRTLRAFDARSGVQLAMATNDGAPIEKIWFSEDGRTVIAKTASDLFQVMSADTLVRKYQFSLTPDAGFILLNSGYFAVEGNANYLNRFVIRDSSDYRVRPALLMNYFDVFHRPDIVHAELRGEDIRPMIGDLTIEKALKSPPPKVSLPIIPESINAKRLKIPFTITPDAGGVAEVRIFQNGKLISSDGTYKDAPGKTYAPVAGKSAEAGRYAEANLKRNATVIETKGGNASSSLRDQLIVRGAPEKKCSPGKAGDPCKGEIEVDVIPGEENTITVVAFNRDNTIQSVPASVSFKSTLPKEEPHLWVVGVGIDQFAGISALKNAHKDAQDFICTYAGKDQISKLGVSCAEDGKAKTLFKPQDIHVVDTLFDAQATKSNILAALDKVARQAKPGDTFVWFVASHGMMDANSNFGIVAHDTQCLNNDCTDIKGHLTSNEILEASKKIKAMKQLVVLDTCHSGGLDSKLSGLYDARVSLLAKNMGLHLYASAQATEAAQDGKPGTNGTFTAQLLEGIKGAAPKNPEGQISVMTLGDYAKQKTIEATQPKSGAKDARPAQTPVIQHFGQDTGLVRLQ